MTRRRGKYNAKPEVAGGLRFDSQAEARRYAELQLLERAGAIAGLTVHPAFELQPVFRDNTGKRHAAIFYIADFGYTEDGKQVVEDVKGQETAIFRLKRKLFLHRYPALVLRVIPAGAG